MGLVKKGLIIICLNFFVNVSKAQVSYNSMIETARQYSSSFEFIENKERKKLVSFYHPLYKLELLAMTKYTRPNERSPEKAEKIWKEAEQGIYVSVGTERGFIGAAMASKVNELMLVDSDPTVNLFNQLNVLLLKLSLDMNDYNLLRYRVDHEYLIQRALTYGLQGDELAFISNENVFNFLKYVVRSSFFLRPVSFWAWNSSIANKVHYQKDPVLFERIQSLAKNHKISVLNCNFDSDSQVDNLMKVIENKKNPISILDISNAWWGSYENPKTKKTTFGYIERAHLESMLLKFRTLANEKSLLLVTNRDNRFFPFKMVWNYFSWRLFEVAEMIRYKKTNEVFIDHNRLNLFKEGQVSSLKMNLHSSCLNHYKN